MPSKVIGIDLGHAAIKVAVLKGSYRGFEAVDFISRRLPLDEIEPRDPDPARDGEEGGRPTADDDADEPRPTAEEGDGSRRVGLRDLQLRVAAELLRDLDTTDATVVAAIPASRVSSWVVEVPFTQDKQIAAVLPGVLEERIPFDLDEVQLHSKTLVAGPHALDGEPGSRLLCTMAPKHTLRELLADLAGIGVDPRFMPTDAGALVNLLRFVPNAPDDAALVLLDVGHASTKLCAVVDGSPLLVRTLDWGSRDVDAALETRYAFGTRDELVDYKHRVASLEGHEDDPTVRSMVELVRRATAPLVAQLRTTLLAFEDERGVEVARLVLTGGGSQLRGLRSHLRDQLGIDTVDLDLPPAPGDVPEPTPSDAAAYALALRGLDASRPDQADFRIGEFAYRRNIVRLQRAAVAVAAAVLVLVVAGLGLSVVKMVRLGARDRALMEEVRTTVQAAFPGISESAMVTSGSAVDVAMAEMEALDQKMAVFDPANQTTALDLLRDLSRAVDKGQKIDVDYLEITSEAIQIKAVTDKFETVDKIEAALKQHSPFEQAAAHDKVKGRNGETRFELTIPLVVAEGE